MHSSPGRAFSIPNFGSSVRGCIEDERSALKSVDFQTNIASRIYLTLRRIEHLISKMIAKWIQCVTDDDHLCQALNELNMLVKNSSLTQHFW